MTTSTDEQMLGRLMAEQALYRKYVNWVLLADLKLTGGLADNRYGNLMTVYSSEVLLLPETAKYVLHQYVDRFGPLDPTTIDHEDTLMIDGVYVHIAGWPAWMSLYFRGSMADMMDYPMIPGMFLYLKNVSNEDWRWASLVLADALTVQLRYHDPNAGFWSLLAGDDTQVQLASDLAMKRASQHSKKLDDLSKQMGVTPPTSIWWFA